MHQPVTQSKPAPTSATAPTTVRPRFPVWLLAALLGLVTLALYWPATHHDFVNYDDSAYVTGNPHVQQGLTWDNLGWALVSTVRSNWLPITMLSHMLDCQLFGLKPWGHHLTSVLLHALNTVLVFLFLRNLTGAVWRSALVAALFGWHPMHVESVAWVAERKDVLSGCLGLLTLIFYGRYARKRSSVNALTNDARNWTLDYGMALLCFALGLMSKPMLVTWPFVLLLLDYWPLQRLKVLTVWQLVREKVPFFALAGLSCVVTYTVQQQAGAVQTVEGLPVGARVGNALISYCRYVEKLCWPTHLAVFYPYPGAWPLAEVLVAGGLILGLTVLLFMQGRRYPFMLMGWLWFLGTLVPVIGLVQVGEQAMADRYSYLPSVGLFIFLIWGAYELIQHWRYRGLALSLAGSAALLVCLALTRQQLGYWRDSETLFRHATAVTKNNCVAYKTLGDALVSEDQFAAAIRQYREAIRLQPRYADAHYNLGIALGMSGELDEAIRQYEEAIRLKPDYIAAKHNLGIALAMLGSTLADRSSFDVAIENYRETIQNSNDPETYFYLGVALGQLGRTREAIVQYREALQLNPDHVGALNNLAWALATSPDAALRNGAEAVRLAEHACQLTQDQEPVLTGTLAAAYAEAGRFPEAMATAQKAMQIATAAGQSEVAAKNRQLLELYRAGKPYHEPPAVVSSSVQKPAQHSKP